MKRLCSETPNSTYSQRYDNDYSRNQNMDKNEYVGLLKYPGELVKEGYLDARKEATALIGLDEVLKYFIHQESPRLRMLTLKFL